MFVVGNTVIDEAVRETSFSCDLVVCKGACCCLAGWRGAPLLDDEIEEIEKAYPVIRKHLPPRSIVRIEARGLVEGRPGDYATECVDDKECVFVYFENGIAKCSFERAHLDGEIQWRKPISCHLFPVRVRTAGQDYVHYEEIPECSGGRDRGTIDDVKLHTFLREPLIRRFGKVWYERFYNHCKGTSPAAH
ncbi:MAG: DUF3109 family protein [Bacteroidetes bacterium]|nr:DUF3109 family protein [Bacteroidota bacterium]